MTPPKGPRGPDEPPLDMDTDEALARFAQTDPQDAEQAASAFKGAPLSLVEDGETGDRFLVYRTKDEVRAELRVDSETFWATQGQMATMFGVTPQNITAHLKNIFSDGELAETAVCKESLHAGRDGKKYHTKFYDLNALIAVGYRVGGPMGTMFRIWATDKLFQLLTKGFTLDERRLKNPGGLRDHFEELLETIRDIRSSESRMWTRILDLASYCDDYNKDDKAQHFSFFAEIQNTMHWAVSQKTAAEIVVAEVDADKTNAGVIHFDGRQPTVKEASTAKNLLGEIQIKALNHITSLTLEFFDSQAEQRRPTTLALFLAKMRELVKLDGRPLKQAGYAGSIGAKQAETHAAEQIREWKLRQRALKEGQGEKALTQLVTNAKALAQSKPKKDK